MLKHIPKSFTPELIKLLMEAGHGENIILSDGNFPHKSVNSQNPSIYIPTDDIISLLQDILHFFPLDKTVEAAAFSMESLKTGRKYDEYTELIEQNGSKLQLVERFEFYRIAKNAFGVIVTSDTTRGGNILIKKGIVSEHETEV